MSFQTVFWLKFLVFVLWLEVCGGGRLLRNPSCGARISWVSFCPGYDRTRLWIGLHGWRPQRKLLNLNRFENDENGRSDSKTSWNKPGLTWKRVWCNLWTSVDPKVWVFFPISNQLVFISCSPAHFLHSVSSFDSSWKWRLNMSIIKTSLQFSRVGSKIPKKRTTRSCDLFIFSSLDVQSFFIFSQQTKLLRAQQVIKNVPNHRSRSSWTRFRSQTG